MSHRCNAIVFSVILGHALPGVVHRSEAAGPTDLYRNDFDGGVLIEAGVSGGLSGVVTVESVQGFAGISGSCESFDGSFLRNITANPPMPTVLSLSGLPEHETVVITFLLAIIDSWDGSSFPPDQTQAPDHFVVTVDGVVVFNETFTTLSAYGAIQSYTGDVLVQEQALGFEAGASRLDNAYEMSFVVAHSTSSLTVEFAAAGAGWHAPSEAGPTEETWAIDGLVVRTPGDCPADGDGGGAVDVSDLLAVLAAWGTNPCGPPDVDLDGLVDVTDLLAVLAAWGQCS